MNLNNGNITVGQILRNPQAVALLRKEAPQVANSPLIGMAGGMTLNQLLSMARGRIPQNKINEILDQLKTF